MMLRNFYYNRLDTDEKQICNALLQSYKNRADSSLVKSMPSEKVILTMIMEHPELYYCNMRKLEGMSQPQGLMLNNRYWVDDDAVSKVENTVRNIVNGIHGSEEMVIRLAHNYLVRNVSYNHVSVKSGKYDHISHSIIGPFLYKTAVCEGIALAFKRLLDEKGIDNAVVLGSLRAIGTSAVEDHMWNVVSVRGCNYYIDVTQDIASTDSRWGKPSYMFYMLTEEELRHTHCWKENFNCNFIRDNPFDSAGRHLRTSDEICRYIQRLPAADKLVCFKCRELTKEVVDNTALGALNKKGWKRLSEVNNAGRYYIYREA